MIDLPEFDVGYTDLVQFPEWEMMYGPSLMEKFPVEEYGAKNLAVLKQNCAPNYPYYSCFDRG